MSNARITDALARSVKVRSMLKSFLEELEPEKWYWQPGEGINHVAWQVGHLAFAQYGLCLKRVRGVAPEDEGMIPSAFLKMYGRGSTPQPGAESNSSVEEILRVLDAVNDRTHQELAQRTDAELDVPTNPAHPIFETNLGAVEWSSQHELTHIGQIVLLRRLMGLQPKW